MIFYIATDIDGKKHALTVATEAAKIDKDYVEIDQPNDKASIKSLLQESFDHIHELEKQINSLQHDSQIAEVTIPSDPVVNLLDPTVSDQIRATSAPSPSRPGGYIGWSIETEANFARLPLAHQLSLAEGALARARRSAEICRTADRITEETPYSQDD